MMTKYHSCSVSSLTYCLGMSFASSTLRSIWLRLVYISIQTLVLWNNWWNWQILWHEKTLFMASQQVQVSRFYHRPRSNSLLDFESRWPLLPQRAWSSEICFVRFPAHIFWHRQLCPTSFPCWRLMVARLKPLRPSNAPCHHTGIHHLKCTHTLDNASNNTR